MTVNLTLSEVASFKAELIGLLEQLRSEIVEEVEKDVLLQAESRDSIDLEKEVGYEASFKLKVELLARQNEEMVECLAALKRIDQGDFGVCISCKEEIELSRLKACPTAARCIRCQSVYMGCMQKSA